MSKRKPTKAQRLLLQKQRKQAATRAKISAALKVYHQAKRERAAIKSARISAALKAYHKTGKTKGQRLKEAAAKLPKLPRGFKRVDSRPIIAAVLERAGKEISARHGYEYDIRHAVNADQSLAYELRFALPAKGFNPQAILTDVANALAPVPGTWVTMGFRFRPGKMSPEEAEKYDRYRGTMQLQAYSQRATSGHMATLEATAEEIYRNVKDKRKGWKAETLFIRMYWEPGGARPERGVNLKK